MSFRKIQLINPPLSSDYMESSRAGSYPPINLIALSTFLEYSECNIEIEILDGEILSMVEIEKRIDADLIGIATNILSYNNSLILAQKAKIMGSTVIFGGHYASALPDTILFNREYIDYVIVGDAEVAILQFINGIPVEEISNFVFRKKNKIVINSYNNINLHKLPILDFKKINIDYYFNNFKKNYPDKPYCKPFVIYSSKGCLWRSKTNGCIYCGIMYKGWRSKSPRQVWNEISNYREKYDIDFIWDVADTITANKKWLKEFAISKPKGLNPSFHLYARADQIDEETLNCLSIINCKELFIGAESGDDTCLSLANKGYSAVQNIKAMNLIKKYDIKPILSIMIGLPCETVESIERTEILIQKMMQITDIDEAFINILLPIPGCRSFDMILNTKELHYKYYQKDLLNLEELRSDWLTFFTQISYAEAQKYRDKLLDLFNIGTSFGKPKINNEIKINNSN